MNITFQNLLEFMIISGKYHIFLFYNEYGTCTIDIKAIEICEVKNVDSVK